MHDWRWGGRGRGRESDSPQPLPFPAAPRDEEETKHSARGRGGLPGRTSVPSLALRCTVSTGTSLTLVLTILDTGVTLSAAA